MMKGLGLALMSNVAVDTNRPAAQALAMENGRLEMAGTSDGAVGEAAGLLLDSR
jgi:hypothetical protein